jgi:raffinose/stachyose/melibiose transport system substrate-binding protein
MELTEYPGPDYNAKLQTALAGGQASDVLGLGDGQIIGQYRAAGDYPCIDLTGRFDASRLTDTARLQVEVDGKVFGTPLAAYTVGLAINNPNFQKAGVEPPRTWDELRAACEKLKAAGVTPMAIGAKDGVHPFFMYIGLASSVLGPDGVQQLRTGERKVTDPDVVAAAQLLIDLQPYYQSGFQATDYITAKSLVANGVVGMMVAGTADFTGFKQVNPEADLSFVAWPGPEAGKKATNTGMELLYTVSETSAPEKQEAAIRFVDWLAGKEAQQLVAENIALPINKEVTEISDPIKTQTVAEAQGGDTTVWYSLPETGETFNQVTNIHGGLWTGRLTAQQFAEQLQSVIKPSGA